ncbi:MAG: hypothetical protein R2733_26660 [Acidimicrobiales bacterium]
MGMIMLLIGIVVGVAAGFSVGWALQKQANAEVIEAMERRLRNAQKARLRAEEQLVVRRAHSNASIAMIRGELDRTRSRLHEVESLRVD